jgi:hypothetical protein
MIHYIEQNLLKITIIITYYYSHLLEIDEEELSYKRFDATNNQQDMPFTQTT